jgi:alginate O-acetyltransferase complex protein AlgJ
VSSSAAGPRPRKHRLRRPVALLLALVFFFAPAVAFLLGARAEQLENRPLTEFPSWSSGWDFFPEFTAWATDHLPLRGEAVRGNATLSERLFDEAPSYGGKDDGGPVGGVPSGDGTGVDVEVAYPPVIEGRRGWLYFGGDVENLCDPTRDVDDVIARLDRLARAVETSGRRFLVTVAPDKTSFYPDQLPATYVGEACSTQRRGEFWDALTERPPSGLIDLRAALAREQDDADDLLYRRTDTHWGPRGAAVYARQLAAALDPALLEGTELVPMGTASMPGELGAMLGRPSEDDVEDFILARPGVTPVGRDSLDLPEMPYGPETFHATTTEAPLFAPRTLLLGDSFSTASRKMLGCFFSHLTLMHNEMAREDAQVVADTIVESDVVVLEIVERTIASGRGALIEDAALATIEQTLALSPR